MVTYDASPADGYMCASERGGAKEGGGEGLVMGRSLQWERGGADASARTKRAATAKKKASEHFDSLVHELCLVAPNSRAATETSDVRSAVAMDVRNGETVRGGEGKRK